MIARPRDVDDGTSVLRLLAGDMERDAIPETRPGVLPLCIVKGIMLDRHVWDEARKVCTRCKVEK